MSSCDQVWNVIQVACTNLALVLCNIIWTLNSSLSFYLPHISAGVDYIPIDVNLTFSADVLQRSINVTLFNDGFDELDEIFNARITILTSEATIVIEDDDPLELVTIQDDDGKIIVYPSYIEFSTS